MPRSLRKRSRTRILAVVLLLCAVVIFISSKLTGGVSGILQVLVPVQHAMSSLIPAGGAEPVQLSAEEAGELRRKLREYEHRLASMSARIADVQERNEELSGIRTRGFEGGRLIHAKIVAADSLPWRDSRLLDQGTLVGVGHRDTVISHFFVTVGEDDGVLDGMSILSGETLLGEITDVSTHTSRVLLVTDPAARPRLVQIGRHASEKFTFVPADFMLRGVGGNRMEVQGVSHRFIDQKTIEVGDTVMTSASDDRLPVQVVIGKVVDIRPDDDNGVLYDLVVEPLVDATKLKRAYVVDASSYY